MSDAVARLNAALMGRYVVERELGEGGTATVYLAQDLKHNRNIALKVLKPEVSSLVNPERFLREIQIAARLRHPHILPLLDSGEGDGLLYYTMPYVEGESIQDRLNHEKQLSIEEAVQLTSEVADALSYAHAKGVIHRDIKPSNILLDSGHAVVADFGIALIVQPDANDRLTVSGVSPGSPLYMSPEQAVGDARVDARSDIYSLGCVLYEMLAGDPPFMGSIPQAILAKKLMEPVPRLTVVRDTVPEYLERATIRALAKTPADRFKSADEFARAIEGDTGGLQVDRVGRLAVVTGAVSRLGVLVATSLAAVLLTIIGFLTTRVYDAKLAMPAEYTPSRLDFPLVGLQAVLPVLVNAFVAFMAFVALKYLWRLSNFGLRRVAGVGDTLDSWREASREAGRKVWTAMSPTTIADLFFFGAIIASILVLVPFREFIVAAVWDIGPGPADRELLFRQHWPLHQTYVRSLTLLIMVILFAWRLVFGYIRAQGVVTSRIGASMWGGLGWTVILLLLVTMPWRLLNDSDHSRVRINGERAYILVETEAELVVYDAEIGSTERYRKGADLGLERLGTDGLLFEGPILFDEGHDPRFLCTE